MRYVKNVYYAALGWLVMPLVAGVCSFFVTSVIFPALCQWFPHVFINYSPVLEPDKYEILSAALRIISATAAIVIYSYALVRFDNERMEYIIRKTEGMYTPGEGAVLYYPRYFYQDLAVALIIPAPLSVASFFVPEHITDYIDPVFDYLFYFGRMFTDSVGIILGILLMSSAILLTRLIAGLKSLRAWQGIWLSDTNREERL